MDDDRSISEAVRHLEDLRSAGYITAEQFRAEVRDLLAGMDEDKTDAGCDEFAPAPDPDPQAEADAAPGWSLETEEAGPLREPDPPLPDEEPRLQRPFAHPDPESRVIIKGNVPWESKERSRGLRVENAAEDKPEGEKTNDKEMHHRQLASLASRDIVRLQRKRNPRKVAIASLLVPGLGHFMLDRPGLGAAFALVWVLGLAFVLGFGEWDALYVVVPTILLASALAHKHAMLHNYYLERRRIMALKRARDREAKLDVERSVREGEWERMGLDGPKD